MILNINADSVVKFTNDLEKINRSALPNAIRSTLNSAAFDVKKETMPEEARKEFIQRQPNFVIAKSRVEMARGWDIDSMKAVVGFIGNEQAVEDLEAQEYGGTIKGRAFIPMDTARGGSHDKKVKPALRTTKIKNIVNPDTMAGKTPRTKFWQAVNKAGKGGFVLSNTNKKILFQVLSVRPLRMKAVYSYEKGRDVKVKETSFMRTASLESAKKMDDTFIREAGLQIDKFYSR